MIQYITWPWSDGGPYLRLAWLRSSAAASLSLSIYIPPSLSLSISHPHMYVYYHRDITGTHND